MSTTLLSSRFIISRIWFLRFGRRSRAFQRTCASLGERWLYPRSALRIFWKASKTFGARKVVLSRKKKAQVETSLVGLLGEKDHTQRPKYGLDGYEKVGGESAFYTCLGKSTCCMHQSPAFASEGKCSTTRKCANIALSLSLKWFSSYHVSLLNFETASRNLTTYLSKVAESEI